MSAVSPAYRGVLVSTVESVVERSQDFTDSAYTSHEHRERILLLCDRLRMELHKLLRVGSQLVSTPFSFSLSLISSTFLYIFYLSISNLFYFPICFLHLPSSSQLHSSTYIPFFLSPILLLFRPSFSIFSLSLPSLIQRHGRAHQKFSKSRFTKSFLLASIGILIYYNLLFLQLNVIFLEEQNRSLENKL